MPTLFHAVLNAFQAFLNGIQPNIKKADIIACFFRFFGGAFGAVPGKRCFLRKADPFSMHSRILATAALPPVRDRRPSAP